MKGFFAACLFAITISCGGGGGSSPTPIQPQHVPGISDFRYTSPSTFPVGTGGGSVSISWQFNFIDNGGDLTSIVFERLDAGGNVTATRTDPISGVSGLKAGTISAVGITSSALVGTFNWRFRVVDLAGNQSNTLAASFMITPAAGTQEEAGPPMGGDLVGEILAKAETPQ